MFKIMKSCHILYFTDKSDAVLTIISPVEEETIDEG